MTTSYKTLSDAASINPIYAPGSTEVWYGKPEFDGYLGAVPGDDLSATHIKVGTVATENLDEVFYVMQGECWSPNGEARSLIGGLGLDHTSMSVGDVIVSGGVRHLVAGCGFKTV